MSSLSSASQCQPASIEQELVNHDLWEWRPGMWVEDVEDGTKAVVVVCTTDGLRTQGLYGSHWFYRNSTKSLRSSKDEVSFHSLDKARLLLHPATQGLLIDKILSSSIVEEMNIRDDGDDACLTVWLTNGNQFNIDTIELSGEESGQRRGRLLCAALLSVLNLCSSQQRQAPIQ